MRHPVASQKRSQPSHQPAPSLPPEHRDEDEISVSVQAHDGHFLERTLRCEGRDLDRAVRLYHHAPIVKQLLKELLVERPRRGRLAIPLRETGNSPHVILTEGGSFVTCLAEDMSIADLPVLPYRSFVAAMDRADQDRSRSRVRLRQLRDLPWETLLSALLDGPGHVTREMIEVFDRDPDTYMIVVAKAYTHSVKFLTDKIVAANRVNRATRQLEVAGMKAFGRAKLCTYLMGFLRTPYILDIMLPLVAFDVGLEVSLGVAIARHPEGGQRLLDLAEKNAGAPKALSTIAAYLMHCCMLNPSSAEAVCLRFRSLPLLYDGWERARIACETFLSLPGEILTERLSAAVLEPRPPIVPRSPSWIFFDDELLEGAIWHRSASVYFPPAARTAAAKAAWGRGLREIEEWRGHKPENVVPIVRETRVGRNDPCPCQSGKKHKQCCLGKATGPTPEEKEAAARAAREEIVRKTLEQPLASRLAEISAAASGKQQPA